MLLRDCYAATSCHQYNYKAHLHMFLQRRSDGPDFLRIAGCPVITLSQDWFQDMQQDFWEMVIDPASQRAATENFPGFLGSIREHGANCPALAISLLKACQNPGQRIRNLSSSLHISSLGQILECVAMCCLANLTNVNFQTQYSMQNGTDGTAMRCCIWFWL